MSSENIIVKQLHSAILLPVISLFIIQTACTKPHHTTVSGQYLVDQFEQPTSSQNTDNSLINTDFINTASYYNLLTEYEKKLYIPLYKAAAERRNYVAVPGEVDNITVSRVMRSMINDHPELIWLTEGYAQQITIIDGQITETEIHFKYNALVGTPVQAIQQMEQAAAPILAEAKPIHSIEAKEKYIHDYLIQNVKYIRNANDQNAYGALVSKQAMCSGYARAFKYLLDRLNIPNHVVTGQLTADGTTDSHAWNIVIIGDRCYNVDVTSDEVVVIKGNQRITKIDDRLLNKTDQEFKKLGYVRESEYSDEFVKLPACN